jgi:RNA polymerase sigma-70 factor (ECF subfamily)
MDSKRGMVPEPGADDRGLVKRMLAGEERAFEEFFAGHFPRLYRFALVRVGQDADVAEEVVQAALCKAMPALRSWRGEATLFTWLCTFCRHEISGHYRRRLAAPETVGLIEDGPGIRGTLEALAAGHDSGPEDEVLRGEIARQVHATLDDLPAGYGDVLELKYIRGLPVDEIATRLGVGLKAAESLLTRARAAFRTVFDTREGSTR